MKSTQNTTRQHLTTSLARRALLLVSFLLFSLGGVWGQGVKNVIWQNNGKYGNINWDGNYRFAPESNSTGEECYTVPQDTWLKMKAETFYAKVIFTGGDPQIQISTGHWSSELVNNHIRPGSGLLADNGDGSYTLTITLAANPELVDNMDEKHLLFTGQDYKVEELYFLEDPFLNTAKDGGATEGSGSSVIEDKGQHDGSFTLSSISFPGVSSLSGITYARVYVTDADGKVEYDKKVDGNNNLLEITGGNEAGASKKNGLYVYENGNSLELGNITVRLNAGANNLNKYKIIVLLSTGTIVNDQEPQWEYEYTYIFKYQTQLISYKKQLDRTECQGQEVTIKELDNIFRLLYENYDGSTWNGAYQLANEWYARWYVVDDSGDLNCKKSIASSTESQDGKWSLISKIDWISDLWKVDGKTVWSDHKVDPQNTGAQWYINEHFANGNTKIAAPNGSVLEDFGGYQIIIEVTDENPFPSQNGGAILPNPLPDIKVRCILEIPRESFISNAKDPVGSGWNKERIDNDVEKATFVLGNKSQQAPNDTKYARIVLCNANGKTIEYDESLLQVTYNGVTATKAGTKQKNGVYVYANGDILDLSKINITLSAGIGKMSNYRIKCLLSTGTMTGNGESLKEPDWDYEFTYWYTYPSRGKFEAKNIDNVKTKHKTVVYDTKTRQTTIRLFSNWYEVTGDCNVSKEELKGAYVRWYLTDINGNIIPGIVDLTATDPYIKLDDNYGYYRDEFDSGDFSDGAATTRDGLYGSGKFDYQGYNPTIILSSDANSNYQEIRVVCVVTTLLDYTVMYDQDPEKVHQEPETMQVKYVYTLKTKDELKNAPFVHYTGESHRDFLTLSGATDETYFWDYKTGNVEVANGSIRQNVHQTDYYVYIDIDPNSDNAENMILSLPIEHWAVFDGDDKRTSTEPLAYFRWYDWKSDKKSNYLDRYDNGRTKLEEKDYGLIAMMLDGASVTPYREEIGVQINTAGRTALEKGQEIVIACDVSRYMDGIVLNGIGRKYDEDGILKGQGYDDKYLVHEPTLSMRYLFHVLPASKIADDIDAAASKLKEVEKTGEYSSATVFQIYENTGWVVVPLNGKFALRADLQSLGQYFINDGNGSLIRCNNLQWYSYYEDGEGLWKKKIDMGGRQTQRMEKYEAREFSGEYTKVGPETESTTTPVEVGNGTMLHLVGYLGNGTVEQPVIHYGLKFLNEQPEKLGSESAHRVATYMSDHLEHGATLTFDDFFDESTRYDRPTTSYENYADAPMVFENAQYGYCYPQLYGQCASTWQIYHGAWWNGYGFAPTHSDYTLLKTMNVPGVSASETYDNQSFYTYWYDHDKTPLYDITYARSGNKKYGTYLYIDAADEARTIAHLEFEAKLCTSSEIFYSAYVANMTELDQTPPQVMFRVSTDIDDGNGGKKRIPVVSFLTGDIQTQGANKSAVWYQVYGSTKIPADLSDIVNGKPRKYYVSIDNYCENTKGADYAIDHISFYTTTAKVQVLQSSTPCDKSSGIEVAIMAKAEELDNYVNDGETLYYRIFKKNDNKEFRTDDAVIGEGIYKGSDGTNYGSVTYFKNTKEDSELPSELGLEETGYYISDGVKYFQFDKREFDLELDATYFVSFYTSQGIPQANNLDGWGNPYSDDDICEGMFSNDITPRVLNIYLESNGDESDATVGMVCGVSEITKEFTITVQYPVENGYNDHIVLFDFYMGSKREFKQITNGNGLYLETALEHMRVYYTDSYQTSGMLPTGYKDEGGIAYTEEMRTLIAEYMDEGTLILSATNVFSHTFTKAGEQKFAAIPIDRWTDDGYICSPLEFVFNVKKAEGGPQLNLGFSDVTYPEDYTRVVRVGLEQLNKVKAESGTYTLHIPVHSFEFKNKDVQENSIVFDGTYLMLTDTDDPTNKETKVVAALQADGGNSRPLVNSTHQYLAVKFAKDFIFHEGYQYELHTLYYDSVDDIGGRPDEDACANDLYFIIKVVPKHVTWKGGSTQWNDDSNWNRSTSEELYKGSDYDNTQGINPPPSKYPAFVPMKFTYVTMPKVSESFSIKAPELVNLERGTEPNVNIGIYTNIGPTTTDNIQYDLMVRYTEEKCVTEGHEGYNNTNEKIYDCEKFYGNWAKEIYFKPGAELVHQHYLTYEKVWVEKELTAGKWTLMSTPLQNTYAGDMYVPKKNGRQETEAFKDITFNLADYSRTQYPIYQRSWAQTGSTVYTSINDMHRNNYSANLSGTVNETFALWTHTYNDVMVDYSRWKGFAIRAHKKEQKDNGQDVLALLRLPKKDTCFSYYDWNDNSQTTDQTATLDRGNKYGKLFTDASDALDDRGLTYGVVYDYGTTTEGKKERTAGTGEVEVDIEDVQEANGYLLVGNPYLCSIDMAQFLSSNSNVLDGDGYWTYENNTVESKQFSTGNYIKPLQSFFVKLGNNVTTGNIVFNKDMMIDRSSSQPQSIPSLTLTATNEHGQSTATVSVGEEARSVETLFDSNLEDVPVVYTVADGQAVSIQQVTELNKPIAFGVTCAASDELVEVTFSDVAQLTSGDVYVVDAVTGEQTAVGEGSILSLQPNDYGRYYLLAGTTDITDKVDVQKGIMVSVRGREVTVSSGEELTQVHALSLTGATVYQDAARSTTTSFTLPSGVYIIQAKNVVGEQQTVKVIVK